MLISPLGCGPYGWIRTTWSSALNPAILDLVLILQWIVSKDPQISFLVGTSTKSWSLKRVPVKWTPPRLYCVKYESSLDVFFGWNFYRVLEPETCPC